MSLRLSLIIIIIFLTLLYLEILSPTSGTDSCTPNPCGPNSSCKIINGLPACTCQKNYIGRAPNCRPECTISSECPNNLSCQNNRCRSPCPGSCGLFAMCRVVNHNPVCTCQPNYVGDPFSGCRFAPSKI